MAVTNIFHDTFTEASLTNLVDHTPDVGASWTEIEKTGTAIAQCRAGEGTTRASATEGDDRILYTADVTPVTNEYDVRHDENQQGSSAPRAWFSFARLTDTSNYYLVIVRLASANPDRELWKTVSGTDTQLATANVGNDAAHKFEIRDAAKKYFGGADFDNLTEDISSADDVITAVGEGGIGWGNAIVATDDIGTGWRIDEFWVDELDVAAAVLGHGMLLGGIRNQLVI